MSRAHRDVGRRQDRRSTGTPSKRLRSKRGATARTNPLPLRPAIGRKDDATAPGNDPTVGPLPKMQNRSACHPTKESKKARDDICKAFGPSCTDQPSVSGSWIGVKFTAIITIVLRVLTRLIPRAHP